MIQNVIPREEPRADEAPRMAEAPEAAFVGRWNRLVSMTNWEKGHIICDWRTALIEAEAAPAEYSDEAWARRVGGVTGQHVGRLRRVYQRFGEVYSQYNSLFWSHFLAAIEWNDAEMWLEGAVQNGWSVAQMRQTRWETLGGGEDERPREEDVVVAEVDEDFEPAQREKPERDLSSMPESSGPLHEGPDFGDDDGRESSPAATSDEAIRTSQEADALGLAVAPVRPFESLPELPADVTEAFEMFKLAIVRHKLAEWREISRDELLFVLDSLKELALAPSAI